MWGCEWRIDKVTDGVIGWVIDNVINCIHLWRKGSANDICVSMFCIHSWRKENTNVIRVFVFGTHSWRKESWMVYTCDIRVNVCVSHSCIRCGICVWVIYVYMWCVYILYVYWMCYACMVMWTSEYGSIKLKWKHRHWSFIHI